MKINSIKLGETVTEEQFPRQNLINLLTDSTLKVNFALRGSTDIRVFTKVRGTDNSKSNPFTIYNSTIDFDSEDQSIVISGKSAKDSKATVSVRFAERVSKSAMNGLRFSLDSIGKCRCCKVELVEDEFESRTCKKCVALLASNDKFIDKFNKNEFKSVIPFLPEEFKSATIGYNPFGKTLTVAKEINSNLTDYWQVKLNGNAKWNMIHFDVSSLADKFCDVPGRFRNYVGDFAKLETALSHVGATTFQRDEVTK